MSFSHWLDRIQARIKIAPRRKATRKRRSHVQKCHDWLTPLTERLEDRALLTTGVTLATGVLTITDADGGDSNDQLRISHGGGKYTITDTGGLSLDVSTISGATGSGTSTVTVPNTGVTGVFFDLLGGNDSVEVNGVQSSFSGDFIIAGGTGTDTVEIDDDIATTGSGAINVTVSGAIELQSGSSLTTVDGGITLSANQQMTPTTSSFDGIDATNTTIQTTGTGNILIEGKAGTGSSGSGSIIGVHLCNGTTVTSTATGGSAGTITIEGTGGNGTSFNNGVQINGSTTDVTSIDGDIQITGFGGGSGSSSFNFGFFLNDSGSVVSTGTGADAAKITIEGTGGSGSNFNHGVRLKSDSTVESIDGDVEITGTGGNASSTGNHGIDIQSHATVQVTDASLSVSGTAVANNSIGVRLSHSSGGRLMSLGNGDISITADGRGNVDDLEANSDAIIGDATHIGAGSAATGDITINADSIEFGGTLSVESSGILTIQPRTASRSIGLGGGSGQLNLNDSELARLQDGFSEIRIGDWTNGTGAVDIDSATFNDDITISGGMFGDSANTEVTAPSVTIDGTIAPGASPGILTVNGNFAFADDSTYEVEIGGTSPGSSNNNHDQIDVTGTVTIGSNVTLNLSSFNGFTSSSGDEFVIVNNDGADAVTSTFNGLAEGAQITNFLTPGGMATITYQGGDGNDISITDSSTSVGVDVSGNLTVSSAGAQSDNNVRLVIDGANYRVVETGGMPLAAQSGTSLDGSDVLIPIASITGDIDITLGDGDDTLEIDFTGGAIAQTINYSGGGQTTGDDLRFTAATVTSVAHSFTNANDGAVDVVIGGTTSTINYIGLEPIDDNLIATDRTFTFTGADESITLSDDGDVGDGRSFIDSDLGESVTFNNPTGSLTIEVNTNGGSGADEVEIDGLDSLFDADLTVNGGDDDDVVVIGNTDVGTGTVNLAGLNVVITEGGITTNGGAASLVATDFVLIEDGALTTSGGTITLNGDSDSAVNPGGIVVIADLVTGSMVDSGGGDIIVGGGTDPSTMPANGSFFDSGVLIAASTVSAGAGNISIRGTADMTGGDGVFIPGMAMVTTTTGNITIVGSSAADDGIDIQDSSSITTMSGTITIDGTSSEDRGVVLNGAVINSNAGDLMITGDASGTADDGVHADLSTSLMATTGNISITGTSSTDDGIELHDGSSVSTTSGNITLDGTASGMNGEDGVLLSSSVSLTISTQTGAITITGVGANQHSGVQLDNNALVESTGTSGAGTITIDGTSDNSDPDRANFEAGTIILNSTVRSVSGPIDIDGTSANGNSLVLHQGATIQSTGTGTDAATIDLTGDGSGLLGFVLAESSVSSADGAISITGNGGSSEGVLLFEGAVTSTGTTATDGATIIINGTSTGDDGVALTENAGNGSSVNSVAGAIAITGNASGGGVNGVTFETFTAINSTGSGANAASITIMGTAGSGQGVNHAGEPINSVDGDIIITGDATTGAEGVFIDNGITVTGTGSVSITGTGNATVMTPTGIFIDGDIVTDSGPISGTALAGRILVDVEQSLESMSNNVTLMTTDTAAVGDNIEFARLSGINAVMGTVTLTAGDDVLLPDLAFIFANSLIEVTVDAGDADPGVGGNADLIGIVSATSFTGTGGADDDTIRLAPAVSMSFPPFVIPVSGFDGMSATLTGNGGADSLRGGDSDDSIDGGTGADTLDGGAGADTLTSGSDNDMISGGAGADLFQWNVGDGSDTFDGGADGDSITIGTGTVTSVTHNFVNNSDGSFGVDAETVTYTNIEPIIDQLTATTRTFTFTGGAETISLTDDGDAGDGQSMIDSDLGEVVTFNHPSDSLTINAGSGSDTVNLTSLDSTFNADLTVNGDGTAMAGAASVNINGAIDVTTGTIAIGTVGDVTQVSFNGGSLTTTANVSIQTTDAISDGDTTVDVSAAGLLLNSGESIGGGTADPLETTISNLEIATSRGLTISETDNLTIGGVDAGTNGISTLSTISIAAGGSIQVDEDVTTDAGTGGDLAITGAVNIAAAASVSALDDSITMTANNDGDDDISINGPATANAEITLAASRDVLVNAAVSNATNNTLQIVSDSDSDGLGGTQVATAGSLTSTGLLFIDGSALFAIGAGAGPFVALDVQDNGATPQISAARSIIINGDDADVNDSNIEINGAVTTSGVAQIQIIANGSVNFGANGDLSAASGSLSTQADENADGTGSLTMNDGTIFTAGNDVLLEAGGDITVGSVQAGDEVEVNSLTGAIVDGGETNVDLAGASLLLLSETGSGTSANPLETAVTNVAGTTNSGAFHLTNTGALTVTTIQDEGNNDIVGVMIEDSVDGDPVNDIVITASSPLTISSDVVNNSGGSILLTASDSVAAGDDLTVDAITISAATGIITLNAGDNLSMDAGATISTTGDVVINLDNGDADSGTGTTSTIAGTFTVGSLTINGEADNDEIDASAIAFGATFNGFAGDDTLIGGSGNDSINGNAGNDVLQGNAGEELFVWDNGDGSDVIDGGAGADELEVNGSTVTPAGDVISVSANGSRFDLTRADGGAGLGPFSLDVGTVETLDLNTLDGDDNVTVNDLTGVADLATLQIDAGAGNDTVDASALPDLGFSSILLEGGDDDDTLTGAAGSSMINGNMGNDSLIGGAADDTIMGGGGDDVMNGGAGGDMLSGQAGDDTMTGGLGDDTMNGGANTDRIVESRDADFDLGDATLTISPSEYDTLVDVEEADLNGGAAANTIDASDFSGTATLMGGDNDDTITGAMGASVVNGNMGNDSLTGLDADDTLMGGGNDDILNGGGGVDMLTGQAGNDTLTGGTGNDTMNGGDNDDLLIWNNGDGSDVMDGGADTDELEVNGSTVTPAGDDITVSANGARFDLTRADDGVGLGPFSLDVGTIETLDLNTLDGNDNVTINDLTGVADLASIEVEGGDGTDTIDASALPDLGLNVLLEGGNDNDTITGSAGPSAINGNMGNDSLIGGAAADTIMGGGGDDIMNGGAGGDMLTGQAGDDTMNGDTGDDTMNGGADTDLIVETRDADFDLGDASLTISPTETDTLMDVEEADLTGGASANTIDASDFSGVATLTGNDGDDTMTGAQGASMINGNMGNDSLLGLGAADGIMGGGGNDIIDGGAGDDTLTGQANDDTITGNTGDDNIMGGDGADLINGSLGNDTISGDAGDDRIQGSNQTDYPGNPLSPIPDLNTLGLTDRDSLLGGTGSDTIAGAIGADFIDGEADADIIDAQSGGDTTNGIDTIMGDIADTIFKDPEDTVL